MRRRREKDNGGGENTGRITRHVETII